MIDESKTEEKDVMVKVVVNPEKLLANTGGNRTQKTLQT